MSCSDKLLSEYRQTEPAVDLYNVPYFSDAKQDYVYKARVSAYGREMTGIFITKKLTDTTHRVVFTTEFGNKLLDFEVTEHTMKVNSILEEMNRRMLVRVLEKDFRLLLREQYKISKQMERGTETVFVSKVGKDNLILKTNAAHGLYSIVNASSRKETIVIRFESVTNSIAEKVTLEHRDIDLAIELSYMAEASQ